MNHPTTTQSCSGSRMVICKYLSTLCFLFFALSTGLQSLVASDTVAAYASTNYVNVSSNVISAGNFTYSNSGSFINSQQNTESNLLNYFDLSVSGNRFICTNPNGRWYTITFDAFWAGVGPAGSYDLVNRTLLISSSINPNSTKNGYKGASTLKFGTTIGTRSTVTSRFFLTNGESFFLEAFCEQPRQIQFANVYIRD
jgi:hypothetical protein